MSASESGNGVMRGTAWIVVLGRPERNGGQSSAGHHVLVVDCDRALMFSALCISRLRAS